MKKKDKRTDGKTTPGETYSEGTWVSLRTRRQHSEHETWQPSETMASAVDQEQTVFVRERNNERG
jgi:hypothetical protein